IVYNDFFFQAEDGIRDRNVTGVQTCALPISSSREKFVGILEWNSCLSKYKRQVEYDTLLFDHPEWKERLDELLELMTEASCCPRSEERRVGKEGRDGRPPSSERRKDTRAVRG